MQEQHDYSCLTDARGLCATTCCNRQATWLTLPAMPLQANTAMPLQANTEGTFQHSHSDQLPCRHMTVSGAETPVELGL